MKKVFKKFLYYLLITSSSLFILTLFSCSADLGIFSDKENGTEEFYKSLGDVCGKYEGNSEFEGIDYDVEKSLTNQYVFDNLDWKDEDGVKKVELRQYVYIVIPFKRDLKIEELALYLKTDDAGANSLVEISAFYFKDSDSCPKDDELKKHSDPDTRTVTKKDEFGNDIQVEEEIEYADPKKESRIESATTSVTNEFESNGAFTLKGFHQAGSEESFISDSCIMAKKDSFLYLRIENNSALNRDLTPINISFINLLIRAVE